MDLKDRKLLHELDMDARMPITQLAKKVGLSRQVIEYRIKRMQQEKIIYGTTAVFDSCVVGFNWYRVVFRLLHVTKGEKNNLLSYLSKHPNTMWLGEVGGNWDIVVNFICKNHFSFNKIFEELISSYGKHIQNYETLIYVDVHDYERSYLLNQKKSTNFKQRKALYHQMENNQKINLDQLDQKIISELSGVSLPSNLEIARKLNVSNNTIRNRIEQMKKNKVLLGYRLFINPYTLGRKSYILFLEMANLNLEIEKNLMNYLKTISQVTFVVRQIGKWRMGIEVETESEEGFQEIFVEIRGKFNDVITNFESFPLFKDHVINYFPKGVLNLD